MGETLSAAELLSRCKGISVSSEGKRNGKMNEMTATKDALRQLFACAIGFFATFAVAYIMKIGNTVVPLVYIFSILCVMLGGYKLANGEHIGCDKSVVYFVCWTGISCVLTLLYCMRGDFDNYALTVPLRGYLVLLCGITMYIAVSSVWSERRWLFIGLTAGILLNLVCSLISLWAFNKGTYFNLYSIFPQDYYQVPMKYENWALNPGAQKITEYRPQGLFLECSHLMLFLICMLPLVFFESRSTLVRVLLCFFGAFATITSKSPNAVFFMLELIVLWAVFRRKGCPEQQIRKRVCLGGGVWLLIIACLVGLFAYLLVKPETVNNVVSQLSIAFSDLNVAESKDGGTTERWNNMQLAFSLLSEYPLGTGWNMETYVMEHNFVGNVASSHTIILKYLVEIGPLGLGLYVYLIYRHSIPLLKRNATSFQKILGIAVLFLFISQATNGLSLAPWMWLLLGMAHAEIAHAAVGEAALQARCVKPEVRYASQV